MADPVPDLVSYKQQTAPAATPLDPNRLIPDNTPLPNQGVLRTLAPGDTVDDRYVIQEHVAEGGMGAVWRVFDRKLERELALKVMKRDAVSSEMARRFLDEARVCGRLQHPGVVPLHEIGELPGGSPYFTMKLVRGRTLSNWLKERPRIANAAPSLGDLPRFVQIFEQICQAVGFAHSQGIIHRDLKPLNVMVGAFGEVQVMDWGLAKEMRSADVGERQSAPEYHSDALPDDELPATNLQPGAMGTQPGRVLGTIGYMPPEQACGNVAQIDRRSDVFALGAILCEILTGQPPYSGNRAEQFQQASTGDLAPAFARLDHCEADRELVEIARACLGRERCERPADAGSVAAMVRAYLASVQEKLRTAERERAAAEARTEGERRRRRLQLAFVSAAMLVLLLVVVGAWWIVSNTTKADGAANAALDETRRLRELARANRLMDGSRYREALIAAKKAVDLAQGARAATRTSAERLLAQVERESLQAGKNLTLLTAWLDVPTETKAARKPLASGRSIKPAQSAAEQYGTALKAWGIDLEVLEVDQALVRLREEPDAVIQELIFGLDQWWEEIRRERRPEAEWRKVAELADRLDSSGQRREFRAIRLENDIALEVFAGWIARELMPCVYLTGEVHGAERRRLREFARRLVAAGVTAEEAMIALSLGQLLEDYDDPDAAEFLLGAAQIAQPDEVLLSYALGQLHERQKRYDRAIEYFRQARGLRPGLGVALADTLRRCGRDSEAAELLLDLTRRDPNNPELHARLGDFYADSKQLVKAEACYRRALELQPDFREGRGNLGAFLNDQLHKHAEAEAEFRAVLAQQPDDPQVHFNLGIALNAQKKHAEAEVAFRAVIRLQPDNIKARLQLANVLIAQRKLSEAEAVFREALERQPDDRVLLIELGALLSNNRGQHQEAVALFRKVIDLRPDDFDGLINLGAALRAQGKFAEAEVTYRKALELRPDHSDVHFRLARVLTLDLKQHGKAEAIYRKLIALTPDNAEAHYELGIALTAQNKHADAEATYRKATELRPDYANAFVNLGNALNRQKKHAEAEAAYRKALALEPDHSKALHNLREALTFQHKHAEAEALFRSVVAKWPNDAASWYGLGISCFSQGKLADAEAAYRKTIELDPNAAEAHCNLGHVLRERGNFEQSLAELGRGHELGIKKPGWRYPSAQWVAQAQRLVEIDKQYADFESGQAKPSTPTEAAEIGAFCLMHANRPLSAVRFFADAFEANPKLQNDLVGKHRFLAAGAAAKAAAGKGTDADRLTIEECQHLSERARAWLAADFAVYQRAGKSASTQTAERIASWLTDWMRDPHLAVVRDPALRAGFPDAERRQWEMLWADIDTLLKKVKSTDPE